MRESGRGLIGARRGNAWPVGVCGIESKLEAWLHWGSGIGLAQGGKILSTSFLFPSLLWGLASRLHHPESITPNVLARATLSP